MGSGGHVPLRVGRRSSVSCRATAGHDRSTRYSGLVPPRFAMSSRDTDFEFDFFEEPETRRRRARERTLRTSEAAARAAPACRAARFAPARASRPCCACSGLIAFAILIVVLLLLWVQSCQEDAKHDAYSDYMTDIGAVGRDSERIGRELSDVLTTPGIKPAELQKQLTGLVQQQEIGADRARNSIRPCRCSTARGVGRGADVSASPARRPRRGVSADSGLEGRGRRRAARLAGGAAHHERRRLGRPLQGAERDRAPSEEISGVEVRTRTSSRRPILRARARWCRSGSGSTAPASGSTSGTPRACTGRTSSRSRSPGGQTLSTTTENTVEASTDLAFAVTVANGGDSQEVKIPVTLTIQQSPTPIVKKATIDIINPDETKTVVFRDFGRLRRAADHADRRRPGAGREDARTTPPSTRSSSRWARRP